MAVTASIKFVQGASTPPAGEALIGVLTTTVTASNGDNSNAEFWEWEVIDVPPTSTIPTGVVLSGAVSMFSFAPDVHGSYHLKLTTKDAAGNSAVDFRTFSVLETTGRLIPPFEARAAALNFAGQKRGWAKYLEEYLHFVDTLTSGIFAVTVVTNASYAALASDYMVALKGLSAPRTVTLPAAVLVGKAFAIKDQDGSADMFPITVATTGSDTIDGAATYVLQTALQSVTLVVTQAGLFSVV